MNLGFTEMAFIFVLALIIFGPKKLPEIGRQVGKALAEFKRASNEFKWQLEAEMRQIEAEATKERLIKAAPQTPPAELSSVIVRELGLNRRRWRFIPPRSGWNFVPPSRPSQFRRN